MLFSIQLRIGGEVSGNGFYSNSSNPRIPIEKHRADGITVGQCWISRAETKNWHTAHLQNSGHKKSASPAQAYA